MRTEAGRGDGRRWGIALGGVSWSDPVRGGSGKLVSVHRCLPYMLGFMWSFLGKFSPTKIL
jgi:hypothetical protein